MMVWFCLVDFGGVVVCFEFWFLFGVGVADDVWCLRFGC